MNRIIVLGVIFTAFFGTATLAHAQEIPSWIKGNAAFWAQDSISDSDFIGGIQYLIANGIITIESEPSMILTGNFVDGDFFHRTSGISTVEFSDGKANLYFDDDFRTLSGPDLFVYLATDKHANDYVNLGMIKQFGGVQSYEIPDDVDFEKYDEVVIWCKSFAVLFGNAHLGQ